MQGYVSPQGRRGLIRSCDALKKNGYENMD
jgi:hypothetical protein